ncbi:hypothetical protein Bca4012_021383 [Brassica carinata]
MGAFYSTFGDGEHERSGGKLCVFSVQAHQAAVFCISAVMLCSATRRFCVCGSLFLASSAAPAIVEPGRVWDPPWWLSGVLA